MRNRVIAGWIICFVSWVSVSVAQSNKPKVLVYGSNAATVSAALQAAMSGVQTLWILDDDRMMPALTTPGFYTIHANKRLDAGIWAKTLQEIAGGAKGTDSLLQGVKNRVNGQLAANAINRLIDSTSLLTKINGVDVTQIVRTGKRWRVKLSNNQSFKVYAIIDGSNTATLKEKLDKKEVVPIKDTLRNVISAENFYQSNKFRTALFCYDDQSIAKVIPYEYIIQPVAYNFFAVADIPVMADHPENTVENIPFRMLSGQAIGAAAAYTAFFETSLDKMNIRRLQGELLAFDGQLIPFQDISHKDVHYGAIQKSGATGIFTGSMNEINGEHLFCFEPTRHVSLEEIRPIITSLFTRSQIWFSDKTTGELNLDQLLDLIKFTALKGDEVNKEVERGWTKKFNFTNPYDPTMPITRRIVAVLFDYYLQPFNVRVNKEGKFVH